MSSTRTNTHRIIGDHFEPDEAMDLKSQRQLRGHLEAIDLAAYTANRKVMTATLSGVDAKKFESLAFATAQARARWVATGIALSETGRAMTRDQITELAALRQAYEELAEVYEAMRRMVERGYLEHRV